MSEVEKMYENVDADKICNTFKHWINCEWKTRQCEDCEHFVYPPFTAEKQIELIKWLANLDICLNFHDEEFYLFTMNLGGYEKDKDFLTVLAKYINNRWTNFNEEEKEQIKRILEDER